MSHRVHQIAKELGIDSKDIVRKLHDEGIPPPPDKDKEGKQKPWTHMSPVSAGLEATVREWFDSGALKTAVETTKHVAAAKIQKAPRKRPGKKTMGSSSSEGDGSSGDSTTAVAEPPTMETAEEMQPADEVETVAVPVVEVHVPQVEVNVEPAPVEAAPVATAPPEVVEAAPQVVAEAPKIEPAVEPEPVAPPAPKVETPVVPEVPVKPVAPSRPPAPTVVLKPVAEVPQKPVRPTVKVAGVPNVPTRPTSVGPVGPQVIPTKAKVQGPSVVRMAEPDQLPAPRAGIRRPPGAPGGPGMQNRGPAAGGPGTGAAMPPMPLPSSTGRKSGASRSDAAPVDDDDAALKKKGRTTRRNVGTGRRGDAGVDLIREWREADILELQERLHNAPGVLRERKREMNKQQRVPGSHAPASKPTHVEVTPPITIRELSEAMGIKSSDILKKLMTQGTMATVNQVIEPEAAQILALEFGVELVIRARESQAMVLEREYKGSEEAAEMSPRAPVVTILGHVDHGKTSLLDKIRSANVAAGEAGGITQHVGAYTVEITGGDGKPKRVTFLDTPGHQAFTAMRARGANVTDVVVLVVAADDGVMPQTIESINHAKAAGVTIVVAMNKIDKAEANPNKVLGQLAEHGLNPVEWGGDTEVVRTSASTGQGVKELIEILDLTAAIKELKASPTLPARGAVIESFMDPNRGVVARVLVQNGTLHIGDTLVCGATWGRVRSISDDKGKQIQEAGPSSPVEVIGLDGVPGAGDKFYVLDPAKAREIAEERALSDREGEIAKRRKVTLENLYDTIQSDTVKELRVILKADVQGSVDVLKTLLTEELSKEVKVKLLHSAVGGVSESDVLLAEASNAIIIGFSVVPDETARKLAEQAGVEIRLYRIIYEITDDIRKALTGMLAPTKQDQVLGHADIRQVIKVSKVGNIAGCIVSDGVLQRNNKYRLLRENTVVVENLTLESLKRFKEDVKEVRGGLECGVKLAGYDDIKIGDRLEAYKTVDVARTL